MRKPPTPPSRRFDVIGLGHGTLDHVCVLPGPPRLDSKTPMKQYFQQPGGQIPTALVALQRWGLRTAYVGPLAGDDGGRMQRESLEMGGVDTTGVVTKPEARSHVSIVLVDRVSGERTIVWQRPPDLLVRPDDLDRHAIETSRCLFADGEDTEAATTAARWTREAGNLVVLDIDRPGPGTEQLVALADVVIAGADFAPRLTGVADLRRALRGIAGMGPSIVAATLGPGGALAVCGGRLIHVPAFAARVVDTTSAGDLFHAGCIHGLLAGRSPEDALRLGAAAGALECETLGGRAAIPAIEAVFDLAGV